MPDLDDGKTAEMLGSGSKPYILKNVGGVYSCSCPAWRNQSIAIEKRTCKHLRKFRGDAAEDARIGSATPPKPATTDATGDEEPTAAGPPLLLAESWDATADLTGWWMSEKLDGVRAYWDGSRFLSRLGNVYHAPDWFVQGLPPMILDGELWVGRKAFQRTVGIVRRQDKPDIWKEVRFLIFDAPAARGTFESRMEFLGQAIPGWKAAYAALHPHAVCRGTDHLRGELSRVEALGGEGLMLRKPGSKYETGRSSTLLKVKSFHDAEAVVVAHEAGKGRHKGRLGALVVRLGNGKEFSVGTGFSDREREAPPAPGATITFRYQELSDGGIPRFPSFVRVRSDDTTAKSPLPAGPVARPAAAKAPVVTTAAAPTAGGKRYFECVEDGASKFWEVWVEGVEVCTRWGKIGTDGRVTKKTFATAEKAQTAAGGMIVEKTDKGYGKK
ncbi:DNA ligase [Fimbriiglobus ruber]|uniref:DNA ligase (ATP) n=1 Tax=Fimbriiglobus ruber TaxID=1908690 RepID=A0A225DGP8_9BACT|nr:DNA ligase [Fimbriiglobus ruber]OWK36349.1 DNA ligase (ATP) [Fimbriiglobus ruber]